MKKVIFTLILGACFFTSASAQEQAIYSQYQIMPVLINPGSIGFDNTHLFLANAKSSWTGFPGSPTTYTLMYNGPLGDKIGLGGGVLNEKIGSERINRVHGAFSFRFPIKTAKVGLGLSLGYLERHISGDVLNNPLVDPNDQVLEGSVKDGQKLFTSAFGAHVLVNDRVFAQLTFPTAIRARLDEIPVDDPKAEESGAGVQYYIFQLGTIIDIPSQNFKLVPSIAIRNIRDVPYQVDLNLQGRFLEDKIIAGLTFRPNTGGSMAFLLGTSYRQFNLYYSYDISFGPFQQYNAGSHELTVAWALKRKKPPVPLENTNLYQPGQ